MSRQRNVDEIARADCAKHHVYARNFSDWHKCFLCVHTAFIRDHVWIGRILTRRLRVCPCSWSVVTKPILPNSINNQTAFNIWRPSSAHLTYVAQPCCVCISRCMWDVSVGVYCRAKWVVTSTLHFKRFVLGEEGLRKSVGLDFYMPCAGWWRRTTACSELNFWSAV